MAKKTKRKVRKAPSVSQTNGAATASAVQAPGVERGFNPDYSYVIKDLKRIGLLAGTFIAILIILSFFLR